MSCQKTRLCTIKAIFISKTLLISLLLQNKDMIKNTDVKAKYLCWSPCKYNLFNNTHKTLFVIAWNLFEHGDKYSSNTEWIIKKFDKSKLASVSILSIKIRGVRTNEFNSQYCKLVVCPKTTCYSAKRFRQGVDFIFKTRFWEKFWLNWAEDLNDDLYICASCLIRSKSCKFKT